MPIRLSFLLPCAEAIDRCRFVGRAFAECRGWELGMVRRIREVLGLETQSKPALIRLATFSYQCSIEEIARVELNSRLSGPNLHYASRRRLVNGRCLPK